MTRQQLAIAIKEHPDLARAWADRVLSAPKRPTVKPPRSRRPAATEKKARREERRAESAAIRAKVMDRSKGMCEACGAAVGIPLLHWHHTLQGNGRRVQAQSEATTLAICSSCHQKAHDGAQYRMALRLVARRIEMERTVVDIVSATQGEP